MNRDNDDLRLDVWRREFVVMTLQKQARRRFVCFLIKLRTIQKTDFQS